jgi:hypothetical protein
MKERGETMNRRQFLARAGAVATWAVIPVAITACGDDDSSPSQPDDGGNGDISGDVATSGGHGHSVRITRAQIDAGDAVTLTLSGGGHSHTVSLTADEVGDIGDGTRVSKPSSSDQGHTHQVTFN